MNFHLHFVANFSKLGYVVLVQVLYDELMLGLESSARHLHLSNDPLQLHNLLTLDPVLLVKIAVDGLLVGKHAFERVRVLLQHVRLLFAFGLRSAQLLRDVLKLSLELSRTLFATLQLLLVHLEAAGELILQVLEFLAMCLIGNALRFLTLKLLELDSPVTLRQPLLKHLQFALFLA